jgi:hypothetical protein
MNANVLAMISKGLKHSYFEVIKLDKSLDLTDVFSIYNAKFKDLTVLVNTKPTLRQAISHYCFY